MRGHLQTGERTPQAPCPTPQHGISRVLLVEDSMLIALDAEDSHGACGVADVVIVATVAAALAALEAQRPDFAVLDYNLGDETSESIAAALTAARVPYCFATGYGDALERTRLSPPYGVLKKPYSQLEIAALLSRVEAELAAG
jgi:CheY-like chemotaxis protein